MSHSFAFFKFENFNQEEANFVCPSQITFDKDELKTSFNLDTRNCLNYSIADRVLKWSKFIGNHEIRRKKAGRTGTIEFSNYIENIKFPIFINFDKNIFIAEISKKDSKDFMRTINSAASIGSSCIENLLKIEPIEVSYELLLSGHKDICQAWIKYKNQSNLKALGLCGIEVDKSNNFKTEEQNGEISYLKFIHDYSGSYFNVSISTNGSIVIYENFSKSTQNQFLPLEIAIDCYFRYLVPDIEI